MSVYAEDPGDSDRLLCCASWSAAPDHGRDSCDEEATEEVDGDPYCAKHAKEARAERLKSEERIGLSSFEEYEIRCRRLPPAESASNKMGRAVHERAMRAPCGCEWVSCDPCGELVPKHDVVNLSPEQSGAAQCDTTACSACRGAEPDETCETCGSCDVCTCPDEAIRKVSLLVGEDLADLDAAAQLENLSEKLDLSVEELKARKYPVDAEPATGNTPEDRLRLQDDSTEDYE